MSEPSRYVTACVNGGKALRMRVPSHRMGISRMACGFFLATMLTCGSLAHADDGAAFAPKQLPIGIKGTPAHEDAIAAALQYLTDYYAFTGGAINVEEQNALDAFQEFLAYMQQGAFDEDTLDTSGRSIIEDFLQGRKLAVWATRFTRHFYDEKGHGYTSMPEIISQRDRTTDYAQSAPSWALLEPTERDTQKNDYNWFEALRAYEYSKQGISVQDARFRNAHGSREYAFICLGHIMHLVGDMGVPEHSWGKNHTIANGMEKYLTANYPSVKYLFYPKGDIGTDIILENNATKREFYRGVTANALPCYPNLRSLMAGLSTISRSTTSWENCIATADKDFRTQGNSVFKTYPGNSNYALAQSRYLLPRITMHLAATFDLFWKLAHGRNQIPWANTHAWTGFVDATASQGLFIDATAEFELETMYADDVAAGSANAIQTESLPESTAAALQQYPPLSVSLKTSKAAYAVGEQLSLSATFEPGVLQGALMDFYVVLSHQETGAIQMLQNPSGIDAVLSGMMCPWSEQTAPLQMNWESKPLVDEPILNADIDTMFPIGHYTCTIIFVDSRYKEPGEASRHVIGMADAAWTLE